MVKLRKIGAVVVAATFLMTSMVPAFAANGTSNDGKTVGEVMKSEFNRLHKLLTSDSVGYLSPDGIPYHSIETILCEAPDYGHESTSEAFSYYMWLEAMNGKLNGDFSGVNKVWDLTEKYIIPSKEQQPECTYSGATYIPEMDLPSDYPSKMGSWSISPSQDKLASELKQTYGTSGMYGMHWLLDVDNFYGFGGSGAKNVYINTCERGPEESTWEVIPHPSIEELKYGSDKGNGFLDIYSIQNGYSKQWRYTIASDADARAVQATYNAYKWAKDAGKSSSVSSSVERATKMGDYLRYAMNDKMLKPIGTSTGNPSDTSMHYLLGWYYSWGGDSSSSHSWGWKIGSSYVHQLYQDPMTAWVMSNVSDFNAKSPNAKSDWAKSLQRQLEFYTWLQTAEGPIAGGCNNSYKGRYEQFPSDTATFYGMGYDPSPVYLDPPSNRWFGNQVWSMQRVAEYYNETGDEMAKNVLDKWVKWVVTSKAFVPEMADGTFRIPGDMTYTGQPKTWVPGSTTWSNPDLHVTMSTDTKDLTQDLGPTGSLCNTLLYYAKGTETHSGDTAQGKLAKEMAYKYLKTIMKSYKDDKGFSCAEARADYKRMYDKLYLPDGWTGKMPNGDVMKNGMKWIDLRTQLKDQPGWKDIQTALDAGKAPVLRYHRFWAQTDIAMAMGVAATLFPKDPWIEGPGPDPEPLLGDVNDDGHVDVFDATLVKAVVLKKKTKSSLKAPKNGDMNKDGDITGVDYMLIKKKINSKN